MRVNLEGEPLDSGVDEIEVDQSITLQKHVNNEVVGIEFDEDLYTVLTIHQVNRLIKGLELAKKVFNLEGE